MITLIHDSASNHSGNFDLIFTDPPFEMKGEQLHSILSNFNYDHLLLIASMHQIISFCQISDMELAFDLVVSHVTPKKSKNYAQPNYLHSSIVYMTKAGVKSAFDRRRVQRQDHYSDEASHYYPSIFHAPKREMTYKYQKNQAMIDDLLGAFNVQSVCDPFAGSGTVGLAAAEHNVDATLIEQDDEAYTIMLKQLKLLGNNIVREDRKP